MQTHGPTIDKHKVNRSVLYHIMVHDDTTSIQVGLVLVEVKRVEVAYCNKHILHKKIFPFMFLHIETPMCYHTIYLK